MPASALDSEWAEDEFRLEIEAIVGEDAHEPHAGHKPAPTGTHTTGAQLRRRLVTAESIADLAAAKKPSLIQRVLGRA
jgi:hypothetical protein